MSTNIKAYIEGLIKTSEVLIFSKTTCPYCIRAKAAIAPLSKNITVIELNQLENGAEIQNELAIITGQRTVPNIFVNGNHIGGCDNTLAAISNGKFIKFLNGSN